MNTQRKRERRKQTKRLRRDETLKIEQQLSPEYSAPVAAITTAIYESSLALGFTRRISISVFNRGIPFVCEVQNERQKSPKQSVPPRSAGYSLLISSSYNSYRQKSLLKVITILIENA